MGFKSVEKEKRTYKKCNFEAHKAQVSDNIKLISQN